MDLKPARQDAESFMVATLCEHDLQMLCDEIGISSSEFAEQTSLKKRVLVVVTTAIRQGLFVRLIAVLAKSWPYAFSESRVMLEHLVANERKIDIVVNTELR